MTASWERLRPWMPWAPCGTPEMARELVERNAAQPGNPAVSEASYVVCDCSGQLFGGSRFHAKLGRNAIEIRFWVDVRHARRQVATWAAAELALRIPEVALVVMHHDQAKGEAGACPTGPPEMQAPTTGAPTERTNAQSYR